MSKVSVAILGTGNIGTDLLIKIMRSQHLECGLFAGRSRDSKGIAMASEMGVKTTCESIGAIERNPDCCEIIFDATNADAHRQNINILKKMDKFVIDLTPAKSGWMCIPALNIHECFDKREVNLVTCGGQASIPIACEIREIFSEVEYIEIATSIASKSAGPGTRINLDEYVQTTREGVEKFCEVKKAKAIININPAVPPINMHNTIYAELEKEPDLKLLTKQIKNQVNAICQYVPGYRLKIEPVYENGRITTIVEVIGLGDFLPTYAGNLDIMTCAGVAVAEEYAKKFRREGL